MTEEINWDEATQDNGFVQLKSDVDKIVVLTNHKLERKPDDAKVAAGKIQFAADCIEEDGNEVEKKFTATSKRLLKKLRPIFEDKKEAAIVRLKILRVGEQFNTQYSVQDLTDAAKCPDKIEPKPKLSIKDKAVALANLEKDLKDGLITQAGFDKARENLD